jgi:predicted small lipoprotein YifL
MRKFFSMMVALAAMFTFAACETTPEEPTPSKGTKIDAPQVEITDVVEDGFTAK